MINREGAPVIKVGRKFLIPIERFLRWIEENKIEA